MLFGRRMQALEETVEIVRAAGGEAIPIAGDVAAEEAVSALVARSGKLDIAVNAAGMCWEAPWTIWTRTALPASSMPT